MPSCTAVSFLSSSRRSTRWPRPLVALHLLVIGSLLWSPVAAVVTPPQISTATKCILCVLV